MCHPHLNLPPQGRRTCWQQIADVTEAERLGKVVDVMQEYVLPTFLDAGNGRPRQARQSGKLGLSHTQFVAPLGHGATEGDIDWIWLNHVTCLFQTHDNVNITHTM